MIFDTHIANNNMNTLSEQEITFESHPVSYILQLEQEIIDLHPSRLTSDDIEDVSDNYQAHLEYNWWRDEQEEIIAHLKAQLTQHQLEMYDLYQEHWED